VDPVAGSYVIEQRTREIEEGARDLLTRIDDMGGTLTAIEAGYIQRQIQESAYQAQVAVDSGNAVVVGVNRFATNAVGSIDVFQVDPSLEAQQIARTRQMRSVRDQHAWRASLDAVEAAARGTDNLVPSIIAAVEAMATVGEVADTLRRVFGEHEDTAV